MIISVKLLGGPEQPYEVTNTMSVLELKSMINKKCKIPVENQKLLLCGRGLIDTKILAEYGIQEGSRISVFVRGQVSVPEESNALGPDLQTLLYNKLRLFYNEEDSRKVADEFMRQFHIRLSNMSLDDIERMATQFLEEDRACADIAAAAAAIDEPNEEKN